MVVLIFPIECNNGYIYDDMRHNLFLSNSICQKSLRYDTKIVLTIPIQIQMQQTLILIMFVVDVNLRYEGLIFYYQIK